jgi:CDP-4-dehydro-6-deoxyglucose reductase
MSYTITVQPSGRRFEAEPGETLLAAGIRQGIGLPYGCKEGACGACKCKKLAGSVTHDAHQDKALSAADAAQGYVLTCRAHAASDVILEAHQVTHAGAFPVKKMPARVARLERLAPDVMRVALQLPASDALQYHPGQYLDIVLPDGQRRSYSLATAPHRLLESGAPRVELHIRHMPGGRFTGHVFSDMKEKEILRIEGPYGSFYLRDDSPKPIILLASGTGMAPVQAMLEHMQFMGMTRDTTLYWGGRRPQDLYLDGWVRAQLAKMSHLRYVPVISDALAEDHWDGRTGFVHAAVLQDFPDLSGHQVYACGTPAMVDAARADFTARAGLPEDEFYADAFVPAAHPATGPAP